MNLFKNKRENEKNYNDIISMQEVINRKDFIIQKLKDIKWKHTKIT